MLVFWIFKFSCKILYTCRANLYITNAPTYAEVSPREIIYNEECLSLCINLRKTIQLITCQLDYHAQETTGRFKLVTRVFLNQSYWTVIIIN